MKPLATLSTSKMELLGQIEKPINRNVVDNWSDDLRTVTETLFRIPVVAGRHVRDTLESMIK